MSPDADNGPGDSTGPDLEALELTETEEDALHDLQLGIEHVHRAYGTLLEFHHQLGHAMDRMSNAEEELREAGHDQWANRLRDEHLPAGAISDQWTYELVEEFSAEFLEDVDAFESEVRDELADGIDHVSERKQQRQLRERMQDNSSSEE
ncbi:hypothetical protein G6M89_14365 [Natronolimnobius sp. AArcel1]|uniref:hypothetical protein n=1 Tax=Natronolimnobius sp. AArcel1 TaxID=1679093 RepID=UPI0013EA07AE|nr:hypothetical protein [Natronolimnobius sp. AArcel1]NGM70178.1 hypothetical protein [Natronolimnobius sp. AArcel1]